MNSNPNDQLDKLFNSAKLSSKLVHFEKIKFDSESDAVYYLYKIGQNLEEVLIIPEMEFL